MCTAAISSTGTNGTNVGYPSLTDEPTSPPMSLPELPRDLQLTILWTVRRHEAAIRLQAAWRGCIEAVDLVLNWPGDFSVRMRARDVVKYSRRLLAYGPRGIQTRVLTWPRLS